MVSDELIDRMKSWRHSGFHAFAGDEIPDVENIIRVGLYMVRGPAASSRLLAGPAQEPKLRYLAKGAGNDHSDVPSPAEHQDFDYLEWVARVTSHIPEPGAQLVHYYGAYSNAHRGISKRREAFMLPDPDAVPEPVNTTGPESGWLKARRKSWARLIRRVYEADPMLCRCGERMRVVGFITKASAIRKILDHVGRKFDPLRLPGIPPTSLFDDTDAIPARAPPRFDDYPHDPFPDYGPQ